MVIVAGLLAAVPLSAGQNGSDPSPKQPSQQAAAELLDYSVAILAPIDVTVPPEILANGALHAILVDLAAGVNRLQIESRLGLDSEEVEALFRLIEMEGLGRQEAGGGWKSLVLALQQEGVERLALVASPLALVMADKLEAHWTALDSTISQLKVAGRLPLNQTGFILVGDYLLGLFQAEAFWQAGLAPLNRKYAFRVYRLNPADAPAGHAETFSGHNDWQIVRYSPSGEPFGFAALLDPASSLSMALLGRPDPEAASEIIGELIDAYRLWYLMDAPPDPPTRRLLSRLEAIDDAGRLRVPLVTVDDLEKMRSIAWWLGEELWSHLQALLPAISNVAVELGYDDPDMLGEVVLATWEMAVHEALWDLVDRGLLLPPIERRSQALVTKGSTR